MAKYFTKNAEVGVHHFKSLFLETNSFMILENLEVIIPFP